MSETTAARTRASPPGPRAAGGGRIAEHVPTGHRSSLACRIPSFLPRFGGGLTAVTNG